MVKAFFFLELFTASPRTVSVHCGPMRFSAMVYTKNQNQIIASRAVSFFIPCELLALITLS